MSSKLTDLINDARSFPLPAEFLPDRDESFDADGYVEECLGELGTAIDVSDCLNEEVTISADLDLGVAGDVTITIEGTLEDGLHLDLEDLVRSVWCGNAPDPTPFMKGKGKRTAHMTMGRVFEAWQKDREELDRCDPLLFALSAIEEVISNVKEETKQRVLDENLPAELRIFRAAEANLKEQIFFLKEHIIELEGAAELSELQAKTSREIIKDLNDRIGHLLRQVQRLEGGEWCRVEIMTEELEAILKSILDAISDDPKPDWKDSLGNAAALVNLAITKTKGDE